MWAEPGATGLEAHACRLWTLNLNGFQFDEFSFTKEKIIFYWLHKMMDYGVDYPVGKGILFI